MPRRLRIQFPDALYHVSARGNNRQAIFLDDTDRRNFLDLLGEGCRRFALELFCFCLMGNHYHLFLRTPRGNLGRAMQWLNTAHATRFHRRHGSSGHVFQGRYHSVLIKGEEHWLHLSMYIHQNPVRAGIAEDPVGYRWSSGPDYVRARPRFEWLQVDEILSQYGPDGPSRRRQYGQECRAVAQSDAPQGDRLKVNIFSREERRRSSGKNKRKKAPADASPPTSLSREEQVSLVARVFGLEPEDLRRKHRKSAARLAAYYHLVENCGLSVTETAEQLQASTSSVSMGLRRLDDRQKHDPVLRAALAKLNFK